MVGPTFPRKIFGTPKFPENWQESKSMTDLEGVLAFRLGFQLRLKIIPQTELENFLGDFIFFSERGQAYKVGFSHK